MTFVDLTEGKITIDGVASVRRGVLFHDFVEYDLRFDKTSELESGTHEELLSAKGLYADLFSLQAEGYR